MKAASARRSAYAFGNIDLWARAWHRTLQAS